MRDEIPSVRKKNPSIPQSVENVILKATAKNPKNRYGDSKEMHSDLLTVLNDDRINEEKITFKYPEHEVEENTAILEKVKEKSQEKLPDKKEKTKEDEIDELLFDKDDKEIKKTNKVILILASLFALIVVVLLVIFFVIPRKIPDVKIPKVKDLTVVEAEAKLKKAGFEVNVETVKEENEKVKKGHVIKTDPIEGRSIKKGSKITIYESLGKETYTVEDYVGSNYIEIQTLLKSVYGLEVKVEKKDVDSTKSYGEQEIIEQSVKAGTVLAKGDEIILYIPNQVEEYPDMVAEGWGPDAVEQFCDKYGLKCDIQYVETTQYEDGTIYYQSRSPKTEILANTGYKYDLVVKFAVTPQEKPEETTDKDSKDKDNKDTSSTDKQ